MISFVIQKAENTIYPYRQVKRICDNHPEMRGFIERLVRFSRKWIHVTYYTTNNMITFFNHRRERVSVHFARDIFCDWDSDDRGNGHKQHLQTYSDFVELKMQEILA